MKIALRKYSLIVIGLVLLCSCRNRKYMMIGIEKTEELKLANTRSPQSNVVNKDSLTLNLKENQKEVYYNSADDYAAKNLDSIPVKIDSIQQKLSLKKLSKIKKTKKVKSSADKLNDAIKLKK